MCRNEFRTTTFDHNKQSENVKNPSLIANDVAGKQTEVKVEIYGEEISLINIYAPNDVTGRKRQFNKIFDILHPSENDKIIGGDFNQIIDMNLDCDGKSQKQL